MKFLVYPFITLSLLISACGSSSNSSERSYQDPHSKMHQKMHDEFYLEEMQKELTGKWQIMLVGETIIDAKQFDGKQPVLIIDVSEGTYAGNDGCNSFKGKVSFKEDKIIFGPTAGTLMACPNMEVSGKIMNSINEKSLNYSMADQLILYEGNKKAMVLKRIE